VRGRDTDFRKVKKQRGRTLTAEEAEALIALALEL